MLNIWKKVSQNPQVSPVTGKSDQATVGKKRARSSDEGETTEGARTPKRIRIEGVSNIQEVLGGSEFQGRSLTGLVILFDSLPKSNHIYNPFRKKLGDVIINSELFKSHLRQSAQVYAALGPAKDKALPATSGIFNPSESLLHNIVDGFMPPAPSVIEVGRSDVSPKFTSLVQVIKSCVPYGAAFRAIVFVRHPITALVIAEMLLKMADRPILIRPRAIHAHMDRKSTDEILKSFASGTYNLLVATEATADLEFPSTSIIVCFDILESHASYAFNRALATNHLIHMLERGNFVEKQKFKKIVLAGESDDSPSFVLEASGVISHDITNVSLDGCQDGIEGKTISDPATSHRLYPFQAVNVLHRIATGLPLSIRTCVQCPFFEYTQRHDGRFLCVVVLSLPPPLQRIPGPLCHSKIDARRSACFITLQRLFEQGLLDSNHFPLPDNDPLSTSSISPTIVAYNDTSEFAMHYRPGEFQKNGMRTYPRKLPDFWNNATDPTLFFPNRLFPVIIFPSKFVELQMAPIVLLTRLPLPLLPSFDLFFSGTAAEISLLPGCPLSLDESLIQDLRRYTLRLHRMICNKAFVCDSRRMPYFLAPLDSSWKIPEMQHIGNNYNLSDISSHIPWDAVSLSASEAFVDIKTEIPALDEDLRDAIIQERRMEYTRRYFVTKVRHDLTPLSKPFNGERETGYKNYLEFCRDRPSGFDGLKNLQTPLIEVDLIPGVLNHLDQTLKPWLPAKGAAKYLIPEMCCKCTISASTFKTVLAFPSIVTRINELLLVKELNAKLFSYSVSDRLLRVALTPPSAGTDVNYERLEIFGDALLKYTSSAYLFMMHPSDPERILHDHRRSLIANKSLWQSAGAIGIPQFILTKTFSMKHWYPAAYSVKESTQYHPNDPMECELSSQVETLPHKSQYEHQLGDKTLADTIEAILAAAYLSDGHECLVPVMKALNIPVLEHDRTSVIGRKALPSPPSISSLLSPEKVTKVEKIIGHTFRYPYYLVQVLTKNSLPGFESTCCERLEFLGDGILDFLTMKYIYNREPDLSPGALTLLKCAMVSNSALAALCVWSGIYEFIDARAHHVGNRLEHYANAVRAKHREETESSQRENRLHRQYWSELDCPKAMSDVMEALLGALYVSDNCSLIGAEVFFETVFEPFYDSYITFKSLSRHAASTLLELFQKQGCHQYSLVKEDKGGKTQCRVMFHGNVLGKCTHSKTSTAMKQACEESLQSLMKNPLSCTCDTAKTKIKTAAKNAADVVNSVNG